MSARCVSPSHWRPRGRVRLDEAGDAGAAAEADLLHRLADALDARRWDGDRDQLDEAVPAALWIG
jgi:hypothetical protein